MVDSRRFLAALVFVAFSASLANAQIGANAEGGAFGPLSCTANATATPQLRSEGYTELLGDILITCTGGPNYPSGTPIPTTTITAYVTPNVAITSRLFNATTGASDVLLLIDDPGSTLTTGAVGAFGPHAPQSVCGTLQGGCPAYAGLDSSGGYTVAVTAPGSATNANNVYQGVLGAIGANTVTFYGVPVLPPATAGVTRTFRITNIRVPTVGLGNTAGINVFLSTSPSTVLPISLASLPVGIVSDPGLVTSIDASPAGGQGAFSQCVVPGGPTLAAQLTFSEGFAHSFKTRSVPLTNSSWASSVPNSGSPGQNVPGGLYDGFASNSESGFVLPVPNGVVTGLADYGTRLKAVFTNLPAGITLYVSTSNANSYPIPGGTSPASYAVLVATSQADESKSDGDMLTPVSNGTITLGDGTILAPLPISSGAASAIWEVVNSNPAGLDTLKFQVYIDYSGTPTYTGGGAPVPSISLSLAPEPGGGSFTVSEGPLSRANIIPRSAIVHPNEAHWLTITSCVLAVPSITSLSPAALPTGTGAFMLTVNGAGFVPLSQIHWNSTGVPTLWVSPTQLTALVPAGTLSAAGTAKITVVNPGDIASAPANFVVSAMVLSSINPASVQSGGPAFTLTATGSGFDSSAVIQWNGAAVATTYVSNAKLTAEIPAFAISTAGQFPITVLSQGVLSNPIQLTVLSTAHLNTLSPGSVQTGSGGFTLTVTGSGFIPSAVVSFNGSPLTTTFVGVTQLSAVVPGYLINTPGRVQVSATIPGGVVSNTLSFDINAAIPSISSTSPSSVTAGGPAFTITVWGASFGSTAVIQWNGLSLSTAHISSTQLTAAVPANLIASAGAVTVTVANPGAVTSNGAAFTIQGGGPSITSLSPSSVQAGGPALTLTVNGSNFVSGAVVTWGGTPLTTTFISSTQLTAAVPASLLSASGHFTVSASNPGGVAAGALSFLVTAAVPSIDSFSPGSVVVGSPAFTLSIAGANFDPAAVITWSGQAITTVFIDNGHIAAAVPATLLTAIGSATLAVVNPGPLSSVTVPFSITPIVPITSTAGILNAASSLPSISPGSLISIYGANLSSDIGQAPDFPLPNTLNRTSVSINGRSAPLLFVSPGQINAQVPFDIPTGAAQMVIRSNGLDSAPVGFLVTPTGPGVFMQAGGHHVLAQNYSDGSLNSALKPAKPGEYVTVYLVGQGLVDHPVDVGCAAPASPFSCPVAPVTVTIGGVLAEVPFAGLAPGMAGVLQINLIMPKVSAGDQPFVVRIGTVDSNTTTISVGQ